MKSRRAYELARGSDAQVTPVILSLFHFLLPPPMTMIIGFEAAVSVEG